MMSVQLGKKELMDIETLEFVAECRETEERLAFTIADLYGWDDETIFLDTSIYLNRPKEVNWAIVCKSDFGRRLNLEYNIHIRTEEERVLKEPLRLLSIKKYSQYRFEAEFSNYVIRTGSFFPQVCRMEELPFCEDEFELARMNPRGIQVKNDFISAMKLWKASSEYLHYGCRRKEEFIDFEECLHQGIDAIEYAYSIVQRDENIRDEMDMKM